MNAKTIINAAAAAIENKPARSAWARGVKAYALELLDNLAELTADQFADPAAVRAALLKEQADKLSEQEKYQNLHKGNDIAKTIG